MALSFNSNFNIGRVIRNLVFVILSLYVGGTVISTFGTAMNCTESPFYTGLSLIGWTVQTITDTDTYCTSLTNTTHTNIITGVSGSGVLSVIGILALAGVVMEFISFK